MTNFDEFWQKNRQALGYAADAQGRHRSRNYFTGLIWESLLSDNIVFRSQVGYIHNQRHTFPESCVDDPANCDFIPSVAQTFPSRLRQREPATPTSGRHLLAPVRQPAGVLLSTTSCWASTTSS